MKLTYQKMMLLMGIGLVSVGFIFQVFFVSSPSDEYEYLSPAQYVGATTDLTDQSIQPTEEDPLFNYTTGSTNYADEILLVDESFTSELPIVVIDTGTQTPQMNVVYDTELEYFVPIDEDAYAYGTISVYENGEDGLNTLSDAASMVENCKLRIRGNSSSAYDKSQYLIKILEEDGTSSSADFFEMGSAYEWVLNISFIDKSLLRNYIAYQVGGELLKYTSDVQYCEVIYKTENGYEYQGVSMMIEAVTQDENRVDIPTYYSNGISFLMRRDRYDPDGLILDNYATSEMLLDGYIEVLYPDEEDITEEDVAQLTEKISNFELAIFSEDFETFVTYRDMIDVDSFVDYFIMNEFFLNYDAGWNSTYFYCDYDGLIAMGPIWDFDQAMDNNELLDADLETTAFHSAPWFEQLLQDPWFVEQIVTRYAELRQNELSDEHIQTLIDSAIAYLGDAVDRDWARWGYYYEYGDYQQEIEAGVSRSTDTYEEEVEKIKYVLTTHGAWLDENIDSLYQFSVFEYQSEEVVEVAWGSVAAWLFILSWIVAVLITQRKVT